MEMESEGSDDNGSSIFGIRTIHTIRKNQNETNDGQFEERKRRLFFN
jgi:hypothetical protein